MKPFVIQWVLIPADQSRYVAVEFKLDAEATDHTEDYINAAVEAAYGPARVRIPDMEIGLLISFHFKVRFEPCPGREAAFREAVLRVVPPAALR